MTLLLVYVVIITIGARLLVIDIFIIPSESMEDTLQINDIIVVNKLIYGPLIGSFERLSGTSAMKRGDILTYINIEGWIIVKRCVAEHGDTITIRDGEVYTNNRKLPRPKNAKFRFLINVADNNRFLETVDSIKRKHTNDLTFNFPLKQLIGNFTYNEIGQLKKYTGCTSTRVIDTSTGTVKLFADPPPTYWTGDNLGPLVVPKKNMTIGLNELNFAIYQQTIKQHEGINIEQRKGGFYINNKPVSSYKFKQNYLFVMGDNRYNSFDSRYEGFIPEQSVIGKAQFILCSTGNFRVDRFMKAIL